MGCPCHIYYRIATLPSRHYADMTDEFFTYIFYLADNDVVLLVPGQNPAQPQGRASCLSREPLRGSTFCFAGIKPDLAAN